MPSAAIALRQAHLQTAPLELASPLQKSGGDEAIYVGGDLSKVFVVSPAQIKSYHDGMRLVAVIALVAGAILFAVGVLLGFPTQSS